MASSTHTNSTTRTFTHTATHLGGIITSALAETLLAIGVSVDRIASVYSYDDAISAWIEERSLRSVRVTLTRPGGTEAPGYSFDIDYTAWDPSQELRDQLARLRRQLAKEPRVASGTTFQVVAVPRPGYRLSDQPGFSDRTAALPSFDGGYRHGTAGSGPGASAVLRSFRTG
jgi:hypothetical protein